MRKHGKDHHNAKLTSEQVEQMRQLRDDQPSIWSYQALADKFGCGASTARDIVQYRTRVYH